MNDPNIETMEKLIHELEGAFVFSETPQGSPYWYSVIGNLKQILNKARKIQAEKDFKNGRMQQLETWTTEELAYRIVTLETAKKNLETAKKK